MNKDQKPSFQVQRRRPGSGTPSGQRERADAPERQRESGSSAGTSSDSSEGWSGGTTGGTTGGGLPGGLSSLSGLMNLFGKSPLLLVGIVVVGICCIGLFLLGGGGKLLSGLQNLDTGNNGSTDYQTQPTQPKIAAGPTATRRPTITPGPAGSAKSWTVMLYQDADDKVLEQDIFIDLNEAERIGSGPNLNIVAQIDRYRGAFTGDGNWTGTRRYFVRQDNDLNTVSSDLVQDLGEVNMASGDTLVDFITWAVANYPADKYVLVLSDHGMGWPGGWSDDTASGSVSGKAPLQSAIGDNLFLNEIDQALGTAR